MRLGLLKASIYDDLQGRFDPQVIDRRIDLIQEEAPDDPHAEVFRGDLHYSLNELDQAIAHYEKAIKKDARLVTAYFGLALAYDKLDQPDEALAMYERAVEESPYNQDYLNNLADQYTRQGRYEDAIRTYDKVLNLDAKYLLTYFELGNLLRLLGRLEQALWHQQEVARLLQDESLTALPKNRGAWYFRTGTEPVYLDGLAQKGCYAHYSLAATLYLLDRKTEAAAQKPQALCQDQAEVRRLVEYDLNRLQEAQGLPAGRIEEVRGMLFGKDQTS